jgi:drug/metabolite transporter (DMT)-like permease
MFAYGVTTVLIKKIVTDVTEPITAASLVFGIGATLVGLMSLPRLRYELPQLTFRRGCLLVVGGTSMSLGILLFYSAASRAPIVAIAPVIAMSPLISISFSQLIARRVEIVDKRIWAGAALVVSGVATIAVSL